VIAVLALALATLVVASAPAAAAPCDPFCEGPPEGGGSAFSGVGTLYYAARENSRKIVGGSCDGCDWNLSEACIQDSGAGAPDDDPGACGAAYVACRDVGGIHTRLRFRPSLGAAYRLVETLCVGGGNRLLTPADFAPNLRQHFLAATPDFTVRTQPATRTLIHLETIFYADYPGDSSQPPTLDKTIDVLGFPIRITAEPSWRWTFEPGAPTEEFDTPGGPYPSTDITHAYDTTGDRTITVEATWRGEYYIAGDGPYDIAEPVTQERTGAVAVVSARSELVAGESG